jgi:hypothetical protein
MLNQSETKEHFANNPLRFVEHQKRAASVSVKEHQSGVEQCMTLNNVNKMSYSAEIRNKQITSMIIKIHLASGRPVGCPVTYKELRP